MTRNQDIDTLLRSLDAADHQGNANTPRARADLQRILSSDSVPAPRQYSTPSTGRGRLSGSKPRAARRVALIGGMVAAVTAGLIIVPSLSGGDPAFASWTSAPAGMTEQDRAAAADECRASNRNVGEGMFTDDAETSEVAIAERRGVWTTVILTGPGGFSAMCITDDSAGLFSRAMTGFVGKPVGDAAPGPRELRATALGTATMSAGDLSVAAGPAGSDVVGVTYKSRNNENVKATVSRGQFAFWVPGNELKDASTHGVEVEVTYRDGTKGTSILSL